MFIECLLNVNVYYWMFIECLYSVEQRQAEKTSSCWCHWTKQKKLYALDNRGTMLYFLGSVVEHIQLQSGPDFGQYRAQNDRNWWISGVAL